MGSCWAFGTIGTLESKYKLTRNDPTFSFDLSEQNLVCGVLGGITALQYCLATPAAWASAPTPNSPTPSNSPTPCGPWQAAGKTASSRSPGTSGVATDLASLKAELKEYGPLPMDICADDLHRTTLGTARLRP